MREPIPDHIRRHPQFAAMMADARRLHEKTLNEHHLSYAIEMCYGCRLGNEGESFRVRNAWGQILAWHNLTIEQLADEVLDFAQEMADEPDDPEDGLEPGWTLRQLADVKAAIEIIERDGTIFVPAENEPDDEHTPEAGGDFPNAG